MKSLILRIKTLTPLWAAGVDKTCDRLHETGIIGSLRWWYEVIVRGLGGKVCDLTADGCKLKSEEYKKVKQKGKSEKEALSAAGLCHVCQVFGATGWQRRFSIEVHSDGQMIWGDSELKVLNIRPPGRNRGWFLSPGLRGDVSLTLKGAQDIVGQIGALIGWLDNWGSLGSKPQLGYGVFKIDTKKTELIPKFEWKPLGTEKPGNLPDLRSFTFFRFRFVPQKEDWWREIPSFYDLLQRPK